MMHRLWPGLMFGVTGASAVIVAASWLAPEIDLKLPEPEVGEAVVPAGSRFRARPLEVSPLLPASGSPLPEVWLPDVERIGLSGGRVPGAGNAERWQPDAVSASNAAVRGMRRSMSTSEDPRIQDASGSQAGAEHPSAAMTEIPPIVAPPPPQPEFGVVLEPLPGN